MGNLLLAQSSINLDATRLRYPEILPQVSLTLAAAFIFMIPALINGRPFLFYDSDHYFTIGKSIFGTIFPQEHLAHSSAQQDLPVSVDIAGGQGTEAPGGGISVFAAGRSPIYSLGLYALSMALGLWSVIALQALVVAWLICRFFRFAWGGTRIAATLLGVTYLTLLSPLGFHANFIMPDVFAGVFLLSTLMLMAGAPSSRLEAGILWCLVVLASTMHTTLLVLNVAVLFIAATLTVLPSLRDRIRLKTVVFTTVSALSLSVAFSAAYSSQVERLSDERLGTAPYLTARLIADGTGDKALDAICGQTPPTFAACAFAEVDYHDHNDVLWAVYGAKYSFLHSDRELQYALQDEQYHFALVVVTMYPVEQLIASLKNFAQQLLSVGVSEITFGAERMVKAEAWWQSGLLETVPGAQECLAAPNDCVHDTRIRSLWNASIIASTVTTLVGLIVVIVFRNPFSISSARAIGNHERSLLVIGTAAVLVLLANAAVCGMISGPHDRYQARLVWIATLVLMCLVPGLVGPRRERERINERGRAR